MHHGKDQLGILQLILLYPAPAVRDAHSYHVNALVSLELLAGLAYYLIGIIDMSISLHLQDAGYSLPR